jgi:hypothetical protein
MECCEKIFYADHQSDKKITCVWYFDQEFETFFFLSGFDVHPKIILFATQKILIFLRSYKKSQIQKISKISKILSLF